MKKISWVFAIVLLAACGQTAMTPPPAPPPPPATKTLLIYPNPVTVVVGTAPVAFEAQISVNGNRSSTSANWALSGPGSISAPTGQTIEYTPPATLGAVTTATITISQDGATPASSVITLKSNVPAGAKYAVNGRVFTFDTGNTRVDLNLSDATAAFPSATVKVNGVGIAFVGGRYQGTLGARLATGDLVSLSITVPEGEITASLAMPTPATITAPTAGAVLPAGSVQINWTTTAEASKYRGGLYLTPYDQNFAPSFNTSGTGRTATVPGMPAGKSVSAYVIAENETSTFTGPSQTGSILITENSTPSSTVAFTTAP
jgi:hypothetical protein